MAVLLNEPIEFALCISDDAHCQRVARLAAAIGHGLAFDARSLHVLSEAAIQHHSTELIGRPAEHERRSIRAAEPLACLETLRIFHGLQTAKAGSDTAVFAEILHLANAFDEKFEWRIFESSPGSELIQDLDDLLDSELWSAPVHDAFHGIFGGNRDRALAKAENLPLSAISKIQKLALSSPDELTIHGLERIALADPVLSADLLRHVNLAKYAPGARVSSVRQAIAYIGTNAARDVMLTSAARGIFASSSLHKLWKHSLRCANTMSSLALQAGLDQNEAFLLGLLHDIGRISLECLDSTARSGYTQLCEAEAPVIWIETLIAGCDHAELGADILAKWNFPHSLTESVRTHHSPELSAEKLTSLLYLVDSTEGRTEDLFSPRRFAAAMANLQITQAQFDRALVGDAVALAC